MIDSMDQAIDNSTVEMAKEKPVPIYLSGCLSGCLVGILGISATFYIATLLIVEALKAWHIR